MKRIVILMLLIVSTLSVCGQELTVKRMEVAPMDLSASTQPRNDRNGNACALVKVQLATPGARFEGNVIGDVEFKTGEYWVYMSEGSYMLNVKHASFLPLFVNFRDYDIKKVEGKVTYVLTLVMPQMGNVPVDDGMRYLVLEVAPENAIVLVDGKQQEVKNGMAKVRLSQGEHRYNVSAVGYASKQGTVVVGSEKKQITVRLESAMATLNVTCATEGANIYVNDELRGLTPWQGSMVSGDYLVEARKEGYRSSQKSISLKDRESQTIHLPALQMISGTIDVNYDPVGTEVWLDGKKLGTSPDIFRDVSVGTHQLRLVSSGYQDKLLQVRVEEGKTQAIAGALQKVEAQVNKPVEPVSSKVSQSNSGTRSSYVSGFITVTGTVVDKRGDPIIGCSILLEGSRAGAVSDFEGHFAIKVPVQGESKLNFSCIGFKKHTVVVDKINNPVLRVVMK